MSDLETPLAGVGHNKPPLKEVLADTHAALVLQVEEIAKKANDAPKKVSSPEEKVKIGEIVVPARKLAKALNSAREDEGRPHLEAKREIDGWFKALMERVERVADTLEARSTEYDREALAAERRRREEEERKARAESERQAEIARKAAEEGNLNKAAKHDERADAALEKAQAVASETVSAADVTRVRGDGVTASSRTTWVGEITDIAKLDLNALRPYLRREDLQKALNSFVRVGGRQCAGAVIREDVKSSFRGA